MKKIMSFFIATIILISINGCADRTPFKEQEALIDTALVYVYAVKTVSIDDSSYDAPYAIKIDDKAVTPKLMQSEYVVYNLKPRDVKISAVKGAALSRDVNLELQSQKSYYLRVKGSQEDESFSFELVDSQKALKEIAKTGLAGSNFIFKDEDKPEGLIETTPDNKKTRTEADEIQRLYEMKEKGILTQEEFKTLKAKVIDK
jgi:hypothetical protein